MKKHINSFIFSDQYERPNDIAKYRPRLHGGLGLHHIESEASAMQIKTFIELAISNRFKTSLFYNAAYCFYVLETSSCDPGLPPTVTMEAISIIKDAIQENEDVESMSAKQWYERLLKKNVLVTEVVDADGVVVSTEIKTKCELEFPQFDWDIIWLRARMPGLNNDQRSFLFKLLHNILPSQERQHRTCRNVDSPHCLLCASNAVDSVWHHAFINCSHTSEAITWMTRILSSLDPAAVSYTHLTLPTKRIV